MTLAEAVERVREADAALCASAPIPLPATGLEAVLAGAVTALARTDWWVPGLRERCAAELRGMPTTRLIDPLHGGRPYHVAPAAPSPALRALYAVGLARAHPESCVLVHLGVGSAADGAWHEALNLAALLRPRVVFLVAVHPLSGDAPLGPQLATSPAALAAAFGLDAEVVDGSSAGAVHDAVQVAREAGGPYVIEARLTPDVMRRP